MKRNILMFTFLAIIMSIVACTPKTGESTTETTPPKEETTTSTTPNPPATNDSGAKCPTFDDAPDKDKAIEDYVLCKDEVNRGNFDKAFEFWQKVYEASPAADGRRNTVFIWGIQIYDHFYKNETDAAKKKEHYNKVMEIYEDWLNCYPDDESFVKGRKAFDIYYNYPEYANDGEKYTMFKDVIDAEGVKTQAFVLNPFTDLLIGQYNTGKIQMPEAQKYAGLIMNALEEGLKSKDKQTRADFQIVESYAPIRLEEFETIKGFYACDYYTSKYFYIFEEDKSDCDAIEQVYSTLRWADCPDANAKLTEVKAAWNKHCVEPQGPTVDPNRPPSCKDLLLEGRVDEALECLEKGYEKATDSETKAKYAYAIGSIYYGKKKNFSTARSWLEKALTHKPGWGKPNLMIGDMYASSGTRCGPGTGWDSQIVIWPAMDMWERAKKDPQTSSKAQKQINKYYQYLPTKQDGFMRGVKHGDSYKVNCWIQRTTTVRLRNE